MFEKEKAKLATDGLYLKRYGEKKRIDMATNLASANKKADTLPSG